MESYRTNRPTPQSSQAIERAPNLAPEAPERPAPNHASSPRRNQQAKPEGSKKKLIAAIVGLVVLLAILALGWWLLMRPAGVGGTIDSSKQQAVFFTNGQVYFGKLSVVNDEYMKLSNIFYLQTKEASANEKNPQITSGQDQNDVELIKLGNEIHGPNDEMIISKSQVLFFENLKEDSTVSKTIREFEDKS